PPLLRLLLVTTGPAEHRLVLTAHHLLLDGCSLPLLCRDLIALYALDGRAATPAPSYRDYLEWLAGRDRDAAVPAWREGLRGHTEPPVLAGLRTGATVEIPTDVPLVLDRETTDRLVDRTRAEGITLATVLQFAWAVVLGNQLGRDRVTFGSTVSGRPAEVPGVEAMIGLFINTVPVAVDLGRDHTLGAALRALQADNARLLEHHHLELSRILAAVDSPAMFDTLVVFESYPVDSS